MMNNLELAQKAKNIADNYKTLYVYGCFGAPMTASNKTRYCNNQEYNKRPARTAMIKAASTDTFGFDCVCLIKGILWGWDGSLDKVYGGAKYASNGVPDIGANSMITKCSGVSTDFSKIEIGEAVWKKGHIGIYIGNGLAVECTPSWKNGVQVTACNQNISGYKRQNWTKHGKLPYVNYVETVGDEVIKLPTANTTPTTPTAPKKTVAELAKEVIDGKWGSGTTRKKRLTDAGYDYNAVQAEVNKILKNSKQPTTTTPKKTVAELAKEVLDGKWGTGNTRKKRLTDAGYDYNAVQAEVNKMLNSNKKTVDQIAKEVIDGKWGNGATRKKRLTEAGYDYKAIQKRVNELL